VDRELRADDGEIVLHDTRYYVCSLDPEQVTAADLLRHVRQHWRIENSLHFLKDRWWDEDRHHTRRPGLSACMAAINNAALSPRPSRRRLHRLESCHRTQTTQFLTLQFSWPIAPGRLPSHFGTSSLLHDTDSPASHPVLNAAWKL